MLALITFLTLLTHNFYLLHTFIIVQLSYFLKLIYLPIIDTYLFYHLFCICFISWPLCKQVLKATLIKNKVCKQTHTTYIVSIPSHFDQQNTYSSRQLIKSHFDHQNVHCLKTIKSLFDLQNLYCSRQLRHILIINTYIVWDS